LSGEAVGAAPERLAWLITGDNPSLVAEAVSNLVSQLVEGVDRSLVLEDYSGEDLDLGVVVDACATPPFLADRRVVVLRDAGSHTADQLQPLSAYLEDPLPTTRSPVGAAICRPSSSTPSNKRPEPRSSTPTSATARRTVGSASDWPTPRSSWRRRLPPWSRSTWGKTSTG